jgi:hypothetical protein
VPLIDPGFRSLFPQACLRHELEYRSRVGCPAVESGAIKHAVVVDQASFRISAVAVSGKAVEHRFHIRLRINFEDHATAAAATVSLTGKAAYAVKIAAAGENARKGKSGVRIALEG